VTAGYQGALSVVARVLVAPGTPVLVEDPGYHPTHRGSLRLARVSFRYLWMTRGCTFWPLPPATSQLGLQW
jgi:DNA-binding transcriptional MocR family regulator